MGLDMYLHAVRYLSGYEHNEPAEIADFDSVKQALDLTGTPLEKNKDLPSLEVEVGAAYWRKANHIHYWFVVNVQDGEDECRPHYVTRGQLQELVSVCEQVLADRSKADELLPRSEGFFFGSNEVDYEYIFDCEYTVNTIKALLECKKLEAWSFRYCSSW